MPDTTAIHVAADVIVGLLTLSLMASLAILMTCLVKAYILPVTAFNPAHPQLESRRDPAWPNYFLGRVQVVDFARLRELELGMVRWTLTGWRARGPLPIIIRPIMAVAGIFLVVLNVVMAGALLVVVVVGVATQAVLLLAVSGFEKVSSRIRGSETSCPTCFHVMVRPAFICPGCGELHRDIRPSGRGTIWRVCTCGTRLPTGTVRATWKLAGVCQSCGEAVHRGAGVLKDVRVPVFGESHAGKTRLIFAGIHELMEKAQARGAVVRFADDGSKVRADAGLDLIRRNERTLKTEWGIEPALSCEIRSPRRGALLHTFDAAGERFRGGEGHEEMRFLDAGHTLLFVVDPFAIPGIRHLVASQPRSELLDEHLAEEARSPDESYGEVVSRIRNAGVKTTKQRLAIVVTKIDLLDQLAVPVPTASDEIESWLHDNGLHNLVIAAEREFREVRYFTVASVVTSDHSDRRASEPFAWALASRKSGVLAEPKAAERAPVAAMS